MTLDTFHDHLGRTSFSVNPAGARGDALGLGGGHPDPAWDPVWEAATAVDSSGWTAEIRVPLSQLRFPADGSDTWGLQVVRYLQRRNEQSSWAFWRLNEQGGPSRYDHLTGLQLDGAGGDLVLGVMGTSVLRDIDSPGLRELLPQHAESLGMDAEYWWGGRSYHLLASAALTSVAGDSAAILGLQRSSARYLQRPDRGIGGNGLFSDAYEPGATAMRGFGVYTRLAREAGDWRWEAAANIRSPGFENNDIAFLTRTDFVWMNANVMREFTRPGSWYRHLLFIAGGPGQRGRLRRRMLVVESAARASPAGLAR